MVWSRTAKYPIMSTTVVKTAQKATLEAVAGTTSVFGERPGLLYSGRPILMSSDEAQTRTPRSRAQLSRQVHWTVPRSYRAGGEGCRKLTMAADGRGGANLDGKETDDRRWNVGW